MEQKLKALSRYLLEIGLPAVAADMAHREFYETADVTRYLNANCQLKVDQFDRVFKILAEESVKK